MADEEDQVPKEINDVLDKEAPAAKPGEDARWKLMSDAKIPVSKHLGSVWRSNKDAGSRAKARYEEAWKQSHRYYNNDQTPHRDTDGGEVSGNRSATLNENPRWANTENMVYANAQAITSAVYAKNPTVEVTASTKEFEAEASFYEDVLNAMMARKYAPGVNLKPIAKRGVIRTHLSNNGIVKIGNRFKEDPDYDTMTQVQKLEQELKSAEDPKKIDELLGQYDALQEHLAVLDPPGPFVKNVDECDLIVDPDSTDPDFADARWIMEREKLSTAYLNARYGLRQEDGSYNSVYKPTHVLSPAMDDTDEEDISSFKLFKEDDPDKYGYEDKESLDRAKYTMVWWCWDKMTRRLYLFADNDWKWPIWVWDDPYQLLQFFPYYRLQFTVNLDGPWSKGETTYYLDQQDMLNEINTIHARALHMTKNKWFFNKRMDDATEMENFLKSDDRLVHGVTIPEGLTKEDLLFTIPHPALAYPEVLNKDSVFAAIDRISAVNSVMRGSEFKTNTTNMAIQEYNSTQQTVLDERIDAIEDWVGRIGYGLLQLVVQFMDQDDFITLVGQTRVAEVNPMSMTPKELAKRFTMSIKGGSSLKPTSAQKKKQFLELAQILGQFEVPFVLELLLKMAEQAFDELLITDEDWAMLRKQEEQAQQTQGGGPRTAQGQPQPGGQQPNPQQIIQQLVARGVPQEQAEQLVASQLGEPQQ